MQGEHAIDMRSDGHFITSFVAALFLGVGARIRAAAGTLGLLFGVRVAQGCNGGPDGSL